MTSLPLIFEQNIVLTGKLVTLKPINEKCDAAVQRMLSDVVTMRYLRFMTHEPSGWTIDEVVQRRKVFLALLLENKSQLFDIYSNDTNAFVGQTAIKNADWEHRCASCGLIIHHTFWRRGYATEARKLCMEYAFEKLKLHRLLFETLARNLAIQKFYAKYGFSFEAIRRECYQVQGTYVDGADYIVLFQDWPEIKKRMDAHISGQSNEPIHDHFNV